MITTEQARQAGVSRHVVARLLADGRWSSVARGVYTTRSGETSWEALVWAGCLLGGEGSRLGPLGSAHLHGLLASEPRPLDMLVPDTGRVRVDGPWVFHRERPGARVARSVGDPSRLTVEDTILDLCAVGTEAEVVGWVTTAVQRRLTSPSRLRHGAATRRRLRHRSLLLALVGDVVEGVESALELRFLRDVERAHQLPRGARQRSRGGLPYVSDVGYDAYRVLVELDGREGHQGMGRFRDMWRDNRFALLDCVTLRYGWYDVVERPCEAAGQLAAALIAGGWAGLPVRCDRCQPLDLAGAVGF